MDEVDENWGLKESTRIGVVFVCLHRQAMTLSSPTTVAIIASTETQIQNCLNIFPSVGTVNDAFTSLPNTCMDFAHKYC